MRNQPLCIISLNYRTADLAIDCLRSLSDQVREAPGTHAVVVDNASDDGSARRIADAIARLRFAHWARVLPLDHNGGYASGNNAGIRASLASVHPPKYLWLLNPDTIVRPGTLAALVEFMDQHPQAGIAGSGLEDAHGKPQGSSHRFPSPPGELERGARCGPISRWLQDHVSTLPVKDEPHACDWVSGSSMIIRREVLEKVGLLDEGYFLYFDEVDYCRRVKNAGWEIWCVPGARVVHLEGQATGIADGRKRRKKYWYDSRRRFFLKHYSLRGLIMADVLWTIGRSLFLLRRALGMGGQAGSDPKWFMFDLLWGDLRALWDLANGQGESRAALR